MALRKDPVGASELSWSQTDPRGYLLQLTETAQQRSRQLGVARLLASAAQDEVAEAELGFRPEVSLSLGGGGQVLSGSRQTTSSSANVSSTLAVGGVLWDGGQRRQLVEWRRQLAEAAQAARRGQEEQIALQTVAASLDRTRYTLQLQIYRQYIRKMACLVESLEAITQVDKGRATELIQAQKQQQTAELAVAITQDVLQVIETRLRRLIGESLPPTGSLAAVLIKLPELTDLQNDLIHGPDIAQASAQALAAQRQADLLVAGQGPKVGWSATGTISGASGGTRVYDGGLGLQVTIPLYRAPDAPQRDAARRRAEAAALQRDDTLDAKKWRLQEVYDTAAGALDRARRTSELLRASQQLRSATLLQWQQLGRRSLFDVMGAESDYYQLRIQQVNALFDAQQAVALMGSMGRGVGALLR